MKISLIPAVIVDLDGTLVNTDQISHFVETRPRDFESFHLESVNSPVNICVYDEIVRLHGKKQEIIVLSGRLEKFRSLSQYWLNSNKVPYDRLILRDNLDFRPDYIVKGEMYDFLSLSYLIKVAIDDRDDLIQLWKSKGISEVKKISGNSLITV